MRNNFKILIVDDEEHLLLIYKKLLSTAGYQVFAAQNGTDAIEMAKKHRPQLVLLDVILPDISGIDVLKTIKKQPETQHCFVVLISSKLVSSEDRSLGLETGADDYLLKPIQNRELVARVDSFMRHKKTIDNLIKSEEHFRVTLNSIGDAVIATNTEGCITRMNPVAESLTGWQLSDIEGKPLKEAFRIVNGFSGEEVENPVNKVLKTGGLVGLANHTKLISKNGKEFQISDSAAPIKNDDGNVIGVVLVFRDVTEEYHVRQQLKENEERFRVIVEGAPDPIFIQSEMKFAFLNPAACRLFGIKSANELLGKPVMERFHPDYHEKIRQRIKELNQDIQSVRELFKQKFIRMDGSEVWVETAGEPIIYDGKNSALVFVRDISQRIEAEEAIREHQRQLESMVGNLPGFVYRCKYDKNWTMLYLSKQFKKITGYPPADFIHNAKRTYNQIIEKSFHPEIFRKWEKTIAENSVFEAEYPVLTHNNQIKWMWERGTGVFDNNGNVLFLEGYVEDITQRREMEQEIKEGEKKYRRITENISDVVWTTDLNFKTTYISPSIELLLGETVERHVKKSIEKKITPESMKTVQHILADEMEKEKNPESDKSRTRKVEIQYYKTDGSLIWVEMNISSIRNEKGEITGFQGVTRDISERKRAEVELKNTIEELQKARNASLNLIEDLTEEIEKSKQYEKELKESESRFSIAFRASPAPLVISEIDTGHFIDVNNRWVEMLGYPKDEQIGRTSKEVGIWRNPSWRDRIIQLLQNNGSFKDEYIEFNTKSGDTILALWSAETIVLGGKKLMLSMIHDITERVKAERELRILKENLEVEVEEKTQELRQRIAELERFQEATIEREFRIKELRDEIEKLKSVNS